MKIRNCKYLLLGFQLIVTASATSAQTQDITLHNLTCARASTNVDQMPVPIEKAQLGRYTAGILRFENLGAESNVFQLVMFGVCNLRNGVPARQYICSRHNVGLYTVSNSGDGLEFLSDSYAAQDRRFATFQRPDSEIIVRFDRPCYTSSCGRMRADIYRCARNMRQEPREGGDFSRFLDNIVSQNY